MKKPGKTETQGEAGGKKGKNPKAKKHAAVIWVVLKGVEDRGDARCEKKPTQTCGGHEKRGAETAHVPHRQNRKDS